MFSRAVRCQALSSKSKRLAHAFTTHHRFRFISLKIQPWGEAQPPGFLLHQPAHNMSTKPKVEDVPDVDISDVLVRHIVVFNDNVNSFDHVIDTFMRVLNHSLEQAEQCAMIIHYKGKCSVKDGEFEELKPFRDAICEEGIDARIL